MKNYKLRYEILLAELTAHERISKRIRDNKTGEIICTMEDIKELNKMINEMV